jgi:hypothetical protein
MTTDPRSALSSDDCDYPPGPLAGVKRGPTSDPGYPQPQVAEVERARLLANRLVGVGNGRWPRWPESVVLQRWCGRIN